MLERTHMTLPSRQLKTKKGFTLIELMVVVSIIGMLASVVLAALSSARNQAKLAAVKQEMLQIRNVLEMGNKSSTGYANLFSTNTGGNGGIWIASAGQCNTTYGTNYGSGSPVNLDPADSALMLAACNKIISIINPSDNQSQVLCIGTQVASTKTYSISINTNIGNSPIYCVGSSGTKFGAINMNDPGCYLNP